MKSFVHMAYAHSHEGQKVETDKNLEAILENPSEAFELSKENRRGGERKDKKIRCINLALHLWTVMNVLGIRTHRIN